MTSLKIFLKTSVEKPCLLWIQGRYLLYANRTTRICTENFWKQRVLKFMKSSKDGAAIFLHTQFIPREKTKTGHVPTWRAMASGLYLRSLENQKQCGICFEYETDEVPLTGTCDRRSCKHVFHEDCLDKWLAINYSCPQCRRPCDNARARVRRRKQRRRNVQCAKKPEDVQTLSMCTCEV